MKVLKQATGLLLTVVVTSALMACSRSSSPPVDARASWNPKAAAVYLDSRANWWTTWPVAARDHGTFCVSCHTALPYMLARPALHRHLNESSPSPDEKKLLDNINKRLRLWSEVGPYYGGGGYNHKTAEARGTESVLNALILANHAAGTGELDDPTRVAMNYMWKEQKTSGELAGAWDWLQFDQEPWEAIDSPYYGACLAAVAVGLAPEDYRSSEEIQSRLSLLRDYLTREAPSQSALNRAMFLWASSKLPGLASPDQQKAIADDLFKEQQQDGGWRLASLAWKWRGWTWKSLVNAWIREDGTPISGKSDGVATAIVIYALQQSGVPSEDIHLQRGLAWLRGNQNLSQGSWPGYSINYRRDPESATGRFMSDAATAYAVLALCDAEPHRAPLAASGSTGHR